MPASMASIRLSLFSAIALVAQPLYAKDPIQDFCRRWGHQTAQVDGKLFIDGGLVTWSPAAADSRNYTNTWLLYSDLNSTTQGPGMPYQYSNLTKNATVPSVAGGVLWADEVNKCFYQFGGEFQDGPPSGSDNNASALWTYDTRLDRWNQSSPGSNAALQRVSYGAGAQIDDLGMGYYLGGYINNRTNKDWKGPSTATSNLISFDFTAGKLSNNSGPADNVGRAEGQLVYLPASDGGLLVYFGGIEDPDRNGDVKAANMSTIHLYDIGSSKWYMQQATGQVPGTRRQFCAGATWADDQSSYNIHLYGGFAAEGPGSYDDAYVLSIPSFTWIHLHTGNATNTQPNNHGACSANVINRDQMLIIGGWFTNTSSCDVPVAQGQHNMNLGYNGERNTLWDKYNPSATRYFVPTPIISVIGGGPTGGATRTGPSTWDNNDLSILLTRRASFSARTATRAVPDASNGPSPSETPSDDNKKSNKAAIAGGVVGGLAALIIILALILLCLHRRKKTLKSRGAAEKNSPAPVELAAAEQRMEMDGAGRGMSMRKYAGSRGDGGGGGEYEGVQHGGGYPSPTTPYTDYPAATPGAIPYDAHQHRYETYPTPTSPNMTYSAPLLNHHHQNHQQHQQTYYPPPPEPSLAQNVPTGDLDPNAAGGGIDRSADTRSTTHTPARFYAPVPVRGRGRFVEGVD